MQNNLGALIAFPDYSCVWMKGENAMFRLWKECEGAENIVISGHVRPDGDCVGSCMAAYLFKALSKACLDRTYK